jgi:hypothetical protein
MGILGRRVRVRSRRVLRLRARRRVVVVLGVGERWYQGQGRVFCREMLDHGII